MIRLFAALDALGAMRFIGEVERGGDCGCVCPECGSPLVARQGSAYDWHFAHEAAHERPGCDAGALRMLRRLIVEHLQEQVRVGALVLPAYRETVALQGSLVHLREQVQWGAQPMGEWQWLVDAEQDSPVARARLDTGVGMRLDVRIVDTASVPDPPPTDDQGDTSARRVFQCRVPPVQALRERAQAVQHLQTHGELVWVHHPDTLGLVQAARQRLAERGRRIYGNWLSMVDAQRQAVADATAPAAPLFYGPAAPASPERAGAHACAPLHAANASFTFYRLSDQEAWLLYLLERVGPSDWRTAQQKFYALAPFPGPFEGWSQALPPAVGQADEAAGIVRLHGFLDAVTYLSRRAHTTRSSRNPADFDGL